jgi:hypothetical protein
VDKRKLEQLERQINRQEKKDDFPPPGFFKTGDVLKDTYLEDLLKLGYSLESVMRCPIYIED